jgi:hypothetical protein
LFVVKIVALQIWFIFGAAFHATLPEAQTERGYFGWLSAQNSNNLHSANNKKIASTL